MLGKLYMNAVLSMLNSPVYEFPDNSEVRICPSAHVLALDTPAQTHFSVGGFSLTDIALDATWNTAATQ